MTYSIIQKSQLEGAHRLDAEYYRPEYLNLNSKLKSKKSKLLGELAKSVICGPFGSAILQEDYREQGVPLMRVAGLNDWFVRDDDLVFIEESLSQKMKRYQVIDGDLVVSQRGTIAMFSKVINKFPEWNISANLISIKRSDLIDFDYLLAFLNSSYGINQLYRRLSGQVQPKITTDDVKQILVFIPDEKKQEEIASFIKIAWQEQESSKSLYSQAENLLLEELEFSSFAKATEDEERFYIVNLSEIKSAHRADAEYFQPKYKKILQKLKDKQVDILEKYFQILRGKNFTYYNEGEVGIIKTKQLGKQFINFEVEDKTNNETVQKEKLSIIKDSDVIFASMGVGSLGKTNIFYDFETKGAFTIDSTLRIFRSKNSGILPEVLTVYLSCLIGQELIYKYIVGTSGIISIYEDYLSNFPIPVLPKPTQQKIASLVQKSHQARRKAKDLLDEAKRKVETSIVR